MSELAREATDFMRRLYPGENPVPLHAPRFLGNERRYLVECVDSTFVSYVGPFVGAFEDHVKKLTGARHAVAMVNGTAALHMTLLTLGVGSNDLVVTQALTFVATAAAIRHAGAEPAFVDVDPDSMGMSPEKLDEFLTARAFPDRDGCRERSSGRRIAACVPMHTFGHPCRIEEICAICGRYGIPVVEDAAEALGSLYKGRHAGTYGRAGIFSFNGNKGVTTGGGGMVISDDEKLSQKLRFITSTAKRSHPWEYVHEEVGYNLRMPNINAALGCAQMEYFDRILQNKRETASIYAGFFGARGVRLIVEGPSSRSNYWLNAIALEDRASRDLFLEYTNANGVQTRPVWALMSDLPPYRDCLHGELGASRWLADHLVNIPSSVRIQ